jgi:hypothetical protein
MGWVRIGRGQVGVLGLDSDAFGMAGGSGGGGGGGGGGGVVLRFVLREGRYRRVPSTVSVERGESVGAFTVTPLRLSPGWLERRRKC